MRSWNNIAVTIAPSTNSDTAANGEVLMMPAASFSSRWGSWGEEPGARPRHFGGKTAAV